LQNKFHLLGERIRYTILLFQALFKNIKPPDVVSKFFLFQCAILNLIGGKNHHWRLNNQVGKRCLICLFMLRLFLFRDFLLVNF